MKLFNSCISHSVPTLRRVDSRIHFDPVLGLILKQKLDDQSSVSESSICTTSSDSTFSTSTTLVGDSDHNNDHDNDSTSEATYLLSVALVFDTSACEGNPSFEQDNIIMHALRLLECQDRQPRTKNWCHSACMSYTS